MKEKYSAILFLRVPSLTSDQKYHVYEKDTSYVFNSLPKIGEVFLMDDQVPYKVENIFHRCRSKALDNDKLIHDVCIFASEFGTGDETFQSYQKHMKVHYPFISFSLSGS